MERDQDTHKADQSDWLIWLQWIFWGQWRAQDSYVAGLAISAACCQRR